MEHLLVTTGNSSPDRFDLRGEAVRIGRGRDCAIRLRDPLASRHHARLFRSDDRWWVEDEGSRNGTLFNGRRIEEPRPLARGDKIEIGKTQLIFQSEVDVLNQTWADGSVLSSPVQEETIFEESAEPLGFRDQSFGREGLEVLYQLASILGAGLRLPELAREVLKAIRSFFHADAACLFLTDRAKKPLRPTLVLSDETSPMISQTVVWQSIQARRAICVRDSSCELPADDVLNLVGEGGSRSIMCSPLLRGDALLGAVHVDCRKPNAFNHDSLTLFTAVAHLLANAIFQIQEIERLQSAAQAAKSDAVGVGALEGESDAIEELHRAVAEVADSDEPVLVVGERGTGKHETARLIHLSSPRASCPQTWLPSLALSPEQIAPVLFGVADEEATDEELAGSGLLETAHGGTLVIADVDALPPEVQAALLSYLRTLKYQRVGSKRRFFADARLIAITTKSLAEEVTAGNFNAELFEAIRGHVVQVPALKDRGDDITKLAARFTRQIAPRAGRREMAITGPVLRALHAYSWPGNVRELQNVIEIAVLRSHGVELTVGDLPGDLLDHVRKAIPSTMIEEPDFDGHESSREGDS